MEYVYAALLIHKAGKAVDEATVTKVLEVAGVKNVIAKQLGSNNLLNNARASICALDSLTTKSQVAKKRNVDLK